MDYRTANAVNAIFVGVSVTGYQAQKSLSCPYRSLKVLPTMLKKKKQNSTPKASNCTGKINMAPLRLPTLCRMLYVLNRKLHTN